MVHEIHEQETKAKEGLVDQLRQQATHPDVQARDIPNSDILDALQTCKGLVYPALKRERHDALVGALFF